MPRSPDVLARTRCSSGLAGAVLLAALLFPHVGAAQSAARDSARALTTRALAARNQRTRAGAEEAKRWWLEAAQLYHAATDRRGEGQTYGNLGLVSMDLGQSDSALAFYRRSLEIGRSAEDRLVEARAVSGIGSVYMLGQTDSALTYLRRAVVLSQAANDTAGEAVTLGNLGNTLMSVGRLDSALVYSKRAVELYRQLGDRANEASSLGTIGENFRLLGRPDSALAFVRASLDVYRSLGQQRGEAIAAHRIGNVYATLGRADSALVHLQYAVRLYETVGDTRLRPGALLNIGILYASQLEQTDSAVHYLEQARALMRANRDRRGEGFTLWQLGILINKAGHPDSALSYYRSALLIQQKMKNRELESDIHQSIGVTLYENLDQPDSAFAHLTRALTIGREIGSPESEWVALHNIGNLYHRRRVGQNLAAAVAYYDSANALADEIRAAAGGDANRAAFAERNVTNTNDWALAWLARPAQVGPRAASLAALAVAERGRARALLDLIQGSSRVNTTPAMPASRAPAPGGDLAAEGSRLAKASFEGGNRAVLSYLMTDDTLLVWLLRPSGVTVTRHVISRDSVATLISALRVRLGTDEDAAARTLSRNALPLEMNTTAKRASPGGSEAIGSSDAAAAALAGILLPPSLLDGMSASAEILIAPQGALSLVPFAILPIGERHEKLGTRFAVRYTPSLTMLGSLPARPWPERGRSAVLKDALVVGNPLMPSVRTATGDYESLSPLPGAATEARSVARMMGATMLSGGDATEATIRQRIANAPFVHFATHGFAYSTDARARESFIALAPTEGQDGLLTVGEILDELPRVAADLVVLSACQTGLGNLKQAEGTVGLQRAFLARGARTVLVTLWNVSDEATALLMERFYAHLLAEGSRMSKAEALRRAQLDVSRTTGFEHARYWAAFQLVGAN